MSKKLRITFGPEDLRAVHMVCTNCSGEVVLLPTSFIPNHCQLCNKASWDWTPQDNSTQAAMGEFLKWLRHLWGLTGEQRAESSFTILFEIDGERVEET